MQSWRQYNQIRRSVESQYESRKVPARDREAKPSSLARKQSDSDDTLRDVEKQDLRRAPSQSSEKKSDTGDQSKDKEQDEDQAKDKEQDDDLPKGIRATEHDGKKVFLVEFDDEGSDPLDAHNWSRGVRWGATAVIGSAGALVGWASSIDSGALTQEVEEFQVSEVAMSLSTGIFLIAFGVGALFSAPLSETAGRNVTYILTLSLFCIFTMAAALAPNYGGLLAFRFISGFFAATPLVTFGGSTSDMWNAVERTYVFPVCACLSFLGPFLAPMVGSFIGQSPLISWRWVYWISLIFGGLVLGAIVLFMPETYGPILLSWRAKHWRQITGDDRYMSGSELSSSTFMSRLKVSALRPLRFFVTEPMVVLFALYLVVVYIILFGFLTGYPFIFGEVFGFSQGSVGLAYIGMNVGFLIAFMMIVPMYRAYVRKLRKTGDDGGNELPPEERLWFAIIGAPWLPISLFWMAWTAYASISYWSCLVATVTFGFATMAIFISTYLYLIDSYHLYSASALVGATLLRYIAAGVMVPVTIPMYKNLGVHWALTLLALISVLVTPIPYVFYKFGAKIRARSDFAQ